MSREGCKLTLQRCRYWGGIPCWKSPLRLLLFHLATADELPRVAEDLELQVEIERRKAGENYLYHNQPPDLHWLLKLPLFIQAWLSDSAGNKRKFQDVQGVGSSLLSGHILDLAGSDHTMTEELQSPGMEWKLTDYFSRTWEARRNFPRQMWKLLMIF